MASGAAMSARGSEESAIVRRSLLGIVILAAVALVMLLVLIWPAAALAADPVGLVRYDHKDPGLVYSGSWTDYAKTGAWQGSYGRSSTGGASVSVTFTGTRLDWIAMKGLTTGIADVYLDGTKKATVNLASPVAVYQQKVWSTGDLTDPGTHVVKIVRSASSAAGKYLTIDAVDIVGTIVAPPTPAPAIASVTASSGPTVGGSTVIIRGTGFVGLSGASAVRFGETPAARYTVNSATQITAVTPAHDPGSVEVWVTAAGGSTSLAAAGTFTYMIRHDHKDIALGRTGTWSDFAKTAAWQSSYGRSSTGGASVTITFTGTRLDWIAMKGSTTGIADVYLDGTKKATVNLASATAVYQQKVWSTGDLTDPGTHVVKIVRSASSAAGKYLTIDAVDILGTLIDTPTRFEQSDPRLLYTGASQPGRWITTQIPGASGGSDIRTNVSWVSLTVTFYGRRLDWIATMGPEMGGAIVSLDGGLGVQVDLHSDAVLTRQKVWSTGTLKTEAHWVEIRWNLDNSAGAYINVDAFDVVGFLSPTSALTPTQIKWAEQRLTDLSYRAGVIDGHADSRTKTAVIAFQKWEGLPRDGVLSQAVWSRLQTASRPIPTRSGGTNPWIEVNRAKQVLLYCKDGAVVWTLEVSTGSPSVGVETPSGDWTILRKRTDSPGGMYMPMYFYDTSPSNLAIHGYPNIPTYPASHGCVRTQYWDQDVLYPLISVGTNVYVY